MFEKDCDRSFTNDKAGLTKKAMMCI